MTWAKHVCGKIDLSTWGVADSIGKALATDYFEEISEAIGEELDDHPPRLTLPWMWGPDGDGCRPGVSDPVMLHIELPLGATGDDDIVFGISLEETVDDYIEGMTNGHDPAIDKICEAEAIERTRVLAQRLRELADKIEAHCANEAEQAEWQRKWGDRAG